MSAPKYDIQLAQGETFYTALTLDESGAVMDLTGYVFEGQIRATPEDPTVLASFGFDESRLASGTVACQNLRKTFCWLVSIQNLAR